MTPLTARLDKWLWAARFYKTRSLASEAIDGGKVHLNGERVKRAKQVQAGDKVEIRQGPYEFVIEVLAIAERRGPASVAATLYHETPESVAARQRVQDQLRTAHALFVPESNSRPTKRERRQLDRFRRRD